MKKALSVILTTVLVLALFSGSAFAGIGNGSGNGNGNGRDKGKEFKDIKGHWGRQSVESIQSRGILNGYDDGTFQPDRTLTQGELAVILARLMDVSQIDWDDEDQDDDEELDDDDTLSDVPRWAKEAVKKGFQHKYLNMKRFHSEQQVNRLEACVAIAKVLEELGELEPVDIENEGIENPFKDRLDISDEDYGYILALYQEGYIKGYDGNFNPRVLLTRAQIAAILDRILNDDDDDDDESDDTTDPEWDDATLTASAITADSVKLAWSGADDDEAVTGYKVMYELDGVDKVKYTRYERIVIGDLDADEEYEFMVEARDAAGNWSNDGPSIEITTLEADEEEEEDTDAPEWPDGADLTISSSVSGMVTIIWPDATDNEGVDAYKLYRDGQLIETLDGDENSVNITGLDSDTEYTFKLRAMDEAGNLSSSLTKTYLTD